MSDNEEDVSFFLSPAEQEREREKQSKLELISSPPSLPLSLSPSLFRTLLSTSLTSTICCKSPLLPL